MKASYKKLEKLLHRGQLREARSLCDKLCRSDGNNAWLWSTLGSLQCRLGELEQAAHSLQHVVTLLPKNAEAHCNLGNILSARGKFEQAIESCQRAVQIDATFYRGYNSLGDILAACGHEAAAIDQYRKAIAINPDYFIAYYNIAKLFRADGRLVEASELLQTALKIEPGYYDACNYLAIVLEEQGKIHDAIACYRRAIKINPDMPDAYSNLGRLMYYNNDYQQAMELFSSAVDKSPNNILHRNLANALAKLCRYSEAIVEYKKALICQPGYLSAQTNLAKLYSELGRFDEAEKMFHQALQVHPESLAVHSDLLFYYSYNVLLAPEAMLAEHQKWDRAHGAVARLDCLSRSHCFVPEKRLRIGYVSPDLCQHAVSYFIEPILMAHDKDRFEVTCYAEIDKEDAVTERLKSLVDHWRPTKGLSDESLSNLIHADGIDVLIDLAGHTANNRLGAFVYKPAPIQATYMGYCNTTGLASMDYWVTDSILHPEASTELATEKRYRLPRCWLSYRPVDDAPAVALSPRGVRPLTFGSLNHLSKLTPEVIVLWSEILQAVPGSRLLLKTKSLYDTDMQARITEKFSDQGISAERLILLPASQHYMEAYHDIDIALDTFPRTGGATTADALWMGVPVITLSGERMIERQGMSMLSAVGLTELIAKDKKAYVAKAVELAADEARRQHLRGRLRGMMAASELCDGVGLARALEEAYRGWWRQWCASTAPVGDVDTV